VPAGAAQLALTIEAAHSTSKPVSILAFSLGSRVVLYAIAAGAIAPGSVQRLVFAASAAPVSAFDVLPAVIAGGSSVTHVFSKKDAVLDRLYPLGAGKTRPSGRQALDMAGVDNVEVEVGHRGYASIAGTLWALATGEEKLVQPAEPTRRLSFRRVDR
jgi:hypothetical protein